MKIIREGPCTTRPPVLDDKNYSYWKPQMTSFFKSLDGKAWRAILARWELLTVIVDGQVVPKFELDWTDAEEQASAGNSRRFNAIFKGVDLNAFELINSCNSAKEAWRILGVAYEVKKFRNMNTIGARVREQNSFRRRDENFKRKPEERTFKYRERGGIGHYQAKCPTYLRKQKKSFCATFFDEESDDSEEEDEYTNAFISRLTEHDSI
ncbi:gag-pol polyprotein [Cucumis melo var. makuwa]|uniref:Gag-pol polyprotein n=1 Tax=Cucumis melo var. makuwa TaxID=1194695 RepID=A0A5A7SXI7_CUCMM|nr:gag-pol polyprotein [Cucumis melo var. makuwa]